MVPVAVTEVMSFFGTPRMLIWEAGFTAGVSCAGEIVSIHRARHAVTLRSAEGAEILMHIGLETVALEGRGFEVHVREGQAVAAGDLLLNFDLDILARGAKSLVSPIVVANGERFRIVSARRGTCCAPKKSAAASMRVTRSSVISRVELSRALPGSLKPT